MRILAGLPGNERAFTQITIQPLDPEELDPEDPSKKRWGNRVGPSDPDDFELDGPTDPTVEKNPLWAKNLFQYTDTLPGASLNRYFYRTAYVDGVHNRSELSLSSPPRKAISGSAR